jgi:hypothetical protein
VANAATKGIPTAVEIILTPIAVRLEPNAAVAIAGEGKRNRPARQFLEVEMGFFGKMFSGRNSKESTKKKVADLRKLTGAGPALAAHSKDAKSSAPTGQNSKAASKK